MVREAVVTVRVVESLVELSLTRPNPYPSFIPANTTTSILFTVVATGTVLPPQVVLEPVGGGPATTLRDDGAGDDLAAGDGIYTGKRDVAAGMVSTCAVFRARSGTVMSDTAQVCATSFPVGPADSNISRVFTDPDTGLRVVPDELLIAFKSGVTESQMASLVAGLPGAIVGSFLELRTIQARLSTAPTSFAQLSAILATVAANPLVERVSANTVGSTSAVTPNDTHYGLLWGMPKIRADEAWVIARGGALIAVLDTGVAWTHPDLSGQVINFPFDFGNSDFDPVDVHSHGTHVAGTAAARSNNSRGVTGVAWNSRILNVKVLSDAGSGTDAKLIAGVLAAVGWGAKILNLSLQNFGISVCDSIATAKALGRNVVAAAGNSATAAINYPGGCAAAFGVGNTTSTDGRSPSSNFGPWVDIAAPGTNIYSTIPGGGYGYKTGTSMAAPMVAGALAVLYSRQPGLTAVQAEERLKRTAVELPAALQLGAGRIDLFEAVFNGSFEESNLALWSRLGSASSVTALGPLTPRNRKRMLFVSTGPAADFISGQVSQTFTIQPGVTNLPVRFSYTFVSEEFPEFVGTIFNDELRITLLTPAGTTITLAREEINTSAFVPIGGINFPGGDNTVGWTMWKNVFVNVPITAGPGTYRIFVTDAGDDIYDTVTLVDGIAFK